MIDLLNIYEEYPFFQSILIHDYFSNLPEEKNNIVRNTLQKFIRKEKNNYIGVNTMVVIKQLSILMKYQKQHF